MSNYKNINVDFSNCDKEPIHIIGRIQPHGFMLVLNAATLVIEQVSENVCTFLNESPAAIIGKPCTALGAAKKDLDLEVQLRNFEVINPQLLMLKEKLFFGFIHRSADKLILECEPLLAASEQERLKYGSFYTQFQSRLNNFSALEEHANLLVNFVQSILDYDRVMLYVFDEDWNGEVIAEKIVPGVHSYLHHHFPASDIPAPARALLRKKHVRQIPDTRAAAVDIIPYINPDTGTPTNIIASELRNPSEIHLEYLHNMEVSASLSFSILVQNKLWGLVTCHHYRPVFIDHWKRQLCNLASKAMSNAILAIEKKRDIDTLQKYKHIEEQLVKQIEKASASIVKGLFEQGPYTLLDIVDCHGAALSFNGKLHVIGTTPTEEQIQEIVTWLTANTNEKLFCSREISRHIPQATNYRDKASGLMALEISKFNRGYILYFKPEIKESRIWAGKPEKVVLGPDLRVHPRKSFEKWEEIVKGKSNPWSQNEQEVAQLLLKDVIGILLKNQTEQLKALNDNLNLTAEELKTQNNRLHDFASIITHNLRSPISNIRGLYNLYQAEPDQETGREVMEKVNIVIANMGATIDDLNVILQTALEEQTSSELVHLDSLIDKQLENLQAVILETNAKIEKELQVQEVRLARVYLESILHNLLSNALKYHSETERPLIKICSWVESSGVYISVSDNGLGLDLNKVKDKLFGLYKTFHRNKDSKGLGLYLTKMQVEELGGTIEVESAPNKGTTFTINFGVNTTE